LDKQGQKRIIKKLLRQILGSPGVSDSIRMDFEKEIPKICVLD
jgi:hypothetical protein